jgi:hypothetical protein
MTVDAGTSEARPVPAARTASEAADRIRPSLVEIEAAIDRIGERVGSGRPPKSAPVADPVAAVEALLGLGEAVLEHWLEAKGRVPTTERKEGFRLLALQRQGAKGDPSFNACRETCRELVYHRNLLVEEAAGDPAGAETVRALRMAVLVARHLCLFVAGKMQEAGLGEFCCSSRPLHADGEPLESPT